MKRKKTKGVLPFIIILIVIMALFGSCFGGDTGGDGKSGCRNCGRSSVYAMGYCKTCYKGFKKWQESNGYT